MKRLLLAIRLFFRTVSSGAFAVRVQEWLLGQAEADRLAGEAADQGKAAAEGPAPARPAPAPTARPRGRSDALSLLAVLQREARFVDFVCESLADYTDEQVGSAARDVHRLCAQVLERLFALRPLADEPEGSAVDVPGGFDAARFRLTGNVTGPPPFHGTLRHGGWRATRCDVPTWTGELDAARIVAPIEVEVP